MQIQSNRAYAANSYLTSLLNREQTMFGVPAKNTGTGANSTDIVSISKEAHDSYIRYSGMSNDFKGGRVALLETNQGPKSVNLDALFSPEGDPGMRASSLEHTPFLTPTRHNIDILLSHLSDALPQFLNENAIPSAPPQGNYTSEGLFQLPASYGYSAEFNKAMESNPAFANELQTVNALFSHYAGMQKSETFRQEYMAAKNEGDIKEVVARHSGLFSDSPENEVVSILFPQSGGIEMSLGR